MPKIKSLDLSDIDVNDPLDFGLKSTPEPLQRWWLIGKGNPYFEVAIKKSRKRLGIPGKGFADVSGFVDWVSGRAARHGHESDPRIYFRINGQILDWENLTRFHYRDLTWPIGDPDLPGRCCPTDPLFSEAERLAEIFGIDTASFEPGFPSATETVVGYILVNRWPHPRSLSGIKWTEEVDKIDSQTGKRFKRRVSSKDLGLKSRGGEGRQLALWYKWWDLDQKDYTIPEIARITDDSLPSPKYYEGRMIGKGIDAVERMMRPLEIPNDS